MKVLFYVMNCMGWLYTLTCIYRIFQLKYRRFDRVECRFERFARFEDIPPKYYHLEADMVEYKGRIYPMDALSMQDIERHKGDFFFMIPDDYKVLRKVKIKKIDYESVNNPKRGKLKYQLVAKYRKIDHGLWILDQWGDAVPTYEILWKDSFGNHRYIYGKGEDYVFSHSFINAVLYVVGLTAA